MKTEVFQKIVEDMQKAEMDLLVTKGKEYTRGDDDRLANFKRVAKAMGMTPLQALGTYLHKHLDSIFSYIQTGQTFSTESIHGRINDARNYLALLSALIIEMENSPIIPGHPQYSESQKQFWNKTLKGRVDGQEN